MNSGGRVSLAIHQCTKPTIAAINGHAVGVGITMTLACVMRVVWSKAKIGFVFSQRGVVMEGCSSFFLPRLIGHARTLQLVIPGAVIPATSKQLDGLFSDLCDRQEDVLPKALEVAEGLARDTSTVSTYMIREMMFRGPSSAEEAHLLESRVMGHMRGSRSVRTMTMIATALTLHHAVTTMKQSTHFSRSGEQHSPLRYSRTHLLCTHGIHEPTPGTRQWLIQVQLDCQSFRDRSLAYRRSMTSLMP